MARLITTILPKFDNDGNDITDRHAEILQEIIKISGGVTLTEIKGQWLDEGVLYTDESVKVETVIVGTPKEIARKTKAVKGIVIYAKSSLEQLAMFYSETAIKADFI